MNEDKDKISPRDAVLEIYKEALTKEEKKKLVGRIKDDIMTYIAIKLYKLRKKSKKRQEDVSDFMGITKTGYSEYENFKSKMVVVNALMAFWFFQGEYEDLELKDLKLTDILPKEDMTIHDIREFIEVYTNKLADLEEL